MVIFQCQVHSFLIFIASLFHGIKKKQMLLEENYSRYTPARPPPGSHVLAILFFRRARYLAHDRTRARAHLKTGNKAATLKRRNKKKNGQLS